MINRVIKLTLSILLFSFVISCALHKKSGKSFIKYRENGENIDVYYEQEDELRHVSVILSNNNRKYRIRYPLGDSASIQMSDNAFLRQRDWNKATCVYEAIIDSTNKYYLTGYCSFIDLTVNRYCLKYPKDSLKGASILYISKLERELLSDAIKHKIFSMPNPALVNQEKFRKIISPYSIKFFICVPFELSHGHW